MIFLAHQQGHKVTGAAAGAATNGTPNFSRRRRFSHLYPPVVTAVLLWIS